MAVDTPRDLDAVQRRADELLDARLDTDFGEGRLAEYMAEALADAFSALRGPDGALDGEAIEQFLGRHRLAELAVELERFVAAAGRDDLVAELEGALDRDAEPEVFAAVLVGPIEAIGGVEPNGDSMVSGGFTTYVIRRGDSYSTFDTGDWEGLDLHEMDGRRAIADDPTLLEARRSVIEFSDPPGSGGVWVSDESGLEDELRDGTLDSPEWDMFWSDVDPDLVEQLVADYTSCSVGENGEPHPDVARLRRLFTTGRAEDESERELLWEVWQDYGDG